MRLREKYKVWESNIALRNEYSRQPQPGPLDVTESLPPATEHSFRMVDGIILVFDSPEQKNELFAINHTPSEFFKVHYTDSFSLILISISISINVFKG